MTDDNDGGGAASEAQTGTGGLTGDGGGEASPSGTTDDFEETNCHKSRSPSRSNSIFHCVTFSFVTSPTSAWPRSIELPQHTNRRCFASKCTKLEALEYGIVYNYPFLFTVSINYDAFVKGNYTANLENHRERHR